MKTRLQIKWLLLILWLTIMLIGGGACSNENSYESEYLKLTGSWKVIKSSAQDMPTFDILIFQKDGLIDAYEPIIGWSYSLISDSEIKFQDPTGEKAFYCKFVFNDDSTLTIYNFVDNYLTEVVKNITFSKI